MTVYELTPDQLSELKAAYFYTQDTSEILPDGIIYPDKIPDDVIFNYYDDVCFVDDDFCCSMD